MTKPITIPNTFAAATSAIPLSQLDQDFSTLANATNDLATYSNYVADTGAADAYIANYPANTNTGSLTTGLRLQFKASNANTGASTLNVQVNGGSIGTAAIRLTDGSALPANTIIAGALVDVMYDGTNFQIMNDPSGGQEIINNLTLSGNLTVAGTSTFTGNVTGNVVNTTTSTITNLTSSNVTITGGTISNVTLDNVTVDVETFSNITINGTASFAAGTVSAPAITTTGDTNTGIFFPAADTIAFTEDGVERMRIASTGDVGIGVTAPTATLHVNNAGAGNSFLVEDSANPDATPFVIDANGQVIKGYTTTVATGNDVGASFTPGTQIHAVSSQGQASLGLFNWINSAGNESNLVFSHSKSGVIGTFGAVSSADSLGAIAFAGDDGTAFITAAKIASEVDGTPGTNDMPGRLVFSTTADGASTPTERMRITSAGNVGIGSTSITAIGAGVPTLELKGTSGSFTGRSGGIALVSQDGTTNKSYIYADTDLYIQNTTATNTRFYTNNTERMRIDSSGNVLVGTSSSVLGKLEVFGGDIAITDGTSDANQKYLYFVNGASTRKAYVGADFESSAGGNGTELIFGTNDSGADAVERMRITSAGEVLVGGTTAISAVSGAVNIERAGTPILSFFRNDTTVLSTNILGAIQFWGNDTTSNTPANLAYIYAIASGDHAAGDNPTDLVFGTTPDGTATVTEAVRIKDGGGLQISRTSVTSPAAGDGNVFSGTYTPTQVSTNTNVGSVTFSECQYMRVGNVVTVSGSITIDVTTASTDTIVKMSLPIASNFAAARNLGGTGSSTTGATYGLYNITIQGNATDDCAELRLRPAIDTSVAYNFTFTYRVI